MIPDGSSQAQLTVFEHIKGTLSGFKAAFPERLLARLMDILQVDGRIVG